MIPCSRGSHSNSMNNQHVDHQVLHPDHQTHDLSQSYSDCQPFSTHTPKLHPGNFHSKDSLYAVSFFWVECRLNPRHRVGMPWTRRGRSWKHRNKRSETRRPRVPWHLIGSQYIWLRSANQDQEPLKDLVQSNHFQWVHQLHKEMLLKHSSNQLPLFVHLHEWQLPDLWVFDLSQVFWCLDSQNSSPSCCFQSFHPGQSQILTWKAWTYCLVWSISTSLQALCHSSTSASCHSCHFFSLFSFLSLFSLFWFLSLFSSLPTSPLLLTLAGTLAGALAAVFASALGATEVVSFVSFTSASTGVSWVSLGGAFGASASCFITRRKWSLLKLPLASWDAWNALRASSTCPNLNMARADDRWAAAKSGDNCKALRASSSAAVAVVTSSFPFKRSSARRANKVLANWGSLVEDSPPINFHPFCTFPKRSSTLLPRLASYFTSATWKSNLRSFTPCFSSKLLAALKVLMPDSTFWSPGDKIFTLGPRPHRSRHPEVTAWQLEEREQSSCEVNNSGKCSTTVWPLQTAQQNKSFKHQVVVVIVLVLVVVVLVAAVVPVLVVLLFFFVLFLFLYLFLFLFLLSPITPHFRRIYLPN